MRPIHLMLGFALSALLSTNLFVLSQESPSKPLTAPTYYISLESRLGNESLVRFNGASNLPPKSIITFTIRDFRGDGWDFYSDEVYCSVNEKGLFEGEVVPQKGKVFTRNLILVADFMPYHPSQPDTVLKLVGKKGEFLGGLENPQRFQVSGWIYGLETIARTQ